LFWCMFGIQGTAGIFAFIIELFTARIGNKILYEK
jgi:hypothetical protein